jgi:hypothetical protein
MAAAQIPEFPSADPPLLICETPLALETPGHFAHIAAGARLSFLFHDSSRKVFF